MYGIAGTWLESRDWSIFTVPSRLRRYPWHCSNTPGSIRSRKSKSHSLSLSTLALAGLGLNSAIIYTTYCSNVQRIIAFFGVTTAAAREIKLEGRQSMSHLQLSFQDQGVGSTRAPTAFVYWTWGGRGVLTGLAILFWRKGLGGRRLCVIFVPVQHRTLPGMGWDLQTASILVFFFFFSGTRA